MKKIISAILIIVVFALPAAASASPRFEPCVDDKMHGSSTTPLGYYDEREYSDRIERWDAYKCDWCNGIIWELGEVFYI